MLATPDLSVPNYFRRGARLQELRLACCLSTHSPKFLNDDSNLAFIIKKLGRRPKRHCSREIGTLMLPAEAADCLRAANGKLSNLA